MGVLDLATILGDTAEVAADVREEVEGTIGLGACDVRDLVEYSISEVTLLLELDHLLGHPRLGHVPQGYIRCELRHAASTGGHLGLDFTVSLGDLYT